MKRPSGLGLRSQDRAEAGGVGPADQVGPQLRAGLVSFLGLLGHELTDQRGKGSGNAPDDLLERLGVVQPLAEDLVDHVSPLERRPARDREVEEQPTL